MVHNDPAVADSFRIAGLVTQISTALQKYSASGMVVRLASSLLYYLVSLHLKGTGTDELITELRSHEKMVSLLQQLASSNDDELKEWVGLTLEKLNK
jgi:hypothetical protein